ncbi:hypothetical protein B7463_g4502, partial [Scytalidium lignicola]
MKAAVTVVSISDRLVVTIRVQTQVECEVSSLLNHNGLRLTHRLDGCIPRFYQRLAPKEGCTEGEIALPEQLERWGDVTEGESSDGSFDSERAVLRAAKQSGDSIPGSALDQQPSLERNSFVASSITNQEFFTVEHNRQEQKCPV